MNQETLGNLENDDEIYKWGRIRYLTNPWIKDDLINDVVNSNTTQRTIIERAINNEFLVAYYNDIYEGGLRKTTKNLNQYSQSLWRDKNKEHSEYRTGILIISLWS